VRVRVLVLLAARARAGLTAVKKAMIGTFRLS
jgi:hypothetical protein